MCRTIRPLIPIYYLLSHTTRNEVHCFQDSAVEGAETRGVSQCEYVHIAIFGYRLGLALGQAKSFP
ncbi:hypothetical protein TMatcc_005221 [Talaromyces marneffei ATCC 18224]